MINKETILKAALRSIILDPSATIESVRTAKNAFNDIHHREIKAVISRFTGKRDYVDFYKYFIKNYIVYDSEKYSHIFINARYFESMVTNSHIVFVTRPDIHYDIRKTETEENKKSGLISYDFPDYRPLLWDIKQPGAVSVTINLYDVLNYRDIYGHDDRFGDIPLYGAGVLPYPVNMNYLLLISMFLHTHKFKINLMENDRKYWYVESEDNNNYVILAHMRGRCYPWNNAVKPISNINKTSFPIREKYGI